MSARDQLPLLLILPLPEDRSTVCTMTEAEAIAVCKENGLASLHVPRLVDAARRLWVLPNPRTAPLVKEGRWREDATRMIAALIGAQLRERFAGQPCAVMLPTGVYDTHKYEDATIRTFTVRQEVQLVTPTEGKRRASWRLTVPFENALHLQTPEEPEEDL